MFKKTIATILIAASVLSIASCSAGTNASTDAEVTDTTRATSTTRATDTDETAEADESSESTEPTLPPTQEAVYEAIDDVATALAECDRESLGKHCSGDISVIEDNMPVITKMPEDKTEVPDYEMMVRTMIAATITYKIDDTTYNGGMLGRDPVVDVTFSYKDYNEVLFQREQFLGAADFNDLLGGVENTIDKKVTLEFDKDGSKYYLRNVEVLDGIYDYAVEGLDYMNSILDMVKDGHLEGDGYDVYYGCYRDTNTIDVVFELNDNACDYVWQYIGGVYLEVSETENEKIYTSDTIVEKNPREIRFTYSQEENFAEGKYMVFLYDPLREWMVGLEFEIRNSAEDGV